MAGLRRGRADASRGFVAARRSFGRGTGALLWLGLLIASVAEAAQVQHLNTQTATATGAGTSGIPTIASFNIPSGKNRVLFIWAGFERDHCSPADGSGGLCTNANTAGTGLGDNWPEPRIGTPPATTTNNQITARVVGPGGTINKQNALVIGGTPSGDVRFITISSSPTGSPAGSALFSLSGFHIALFESEIQTLLGGAASGAVSVALPDVNVSTNAGDDALLVASVYQNVEQTVTGMVRNATATAQVSTGTSGNYNLAPAGYDAGQAPDEADDGKLVLATSSSTEGFATPAGHVSLTGVLATSNNNGTFDTPNGNLHNEPNGFSGAAFFRNGGATPGSLYTVTSAAPATPLVFGGTNASFLIESDNADVGDAPISFGNATHTVSGIRLGASIDADASLLNNAMATGDDTNNTDDEDGVTLSPLLPIGQSVVVPVNIQNGGGFLSAWFDWNADGDFRDTGEQMVTSQAVAVGAINLNITVPSTAVIGPTFARLRVCTNNTALDNCNTPAGTVQSGEVEDYAFSVARSLTLRKTTLDGAGGPFGFALTNTVQATGTVTTAAAATPTQVDGDAGTAGTQVFAIVSPTTAVTINENSLPAGWSLSGATCINAASATIGSLSGSTYTLTGAEIAASTAFTCTFTNRKLPILRLQKSLPGGRASAGDQFTLTIAGTGGPASATTTGSGTTATGVATLTAGAVGATYTLSESGANLAGYASTYTCTNALAGGQTPAGNGTSFTLTAAAGDDLTCTYSNQRLSQADLSISKDDGRMLVEVGDVLTYQIVLRNDGPDDATGIRIEDTVPTSLVGATWTCTGNACPSPAGSGSIAETLDLPAAMEVTYQLAATVADGQAGFVENVAQLVVNSAAPDYVIDQNATDNIAVDVDWIDAVFRDGFESL